jgi:hypothetical protein
MTRLNHNLARVTKSVKNIEGALITVINFLRVMKQFAFSLLPMKRNSSIDFQDYFHFEMGN